MFSAQDNATSTVPSVPVIPGSLPPQTSVASSTPSTTQPVPPVPPMVNTISGINMPGKKKFSHKLLFLIPIFLLVGTMVVITILLPSLRKANSVTPVDTPTPTLLPATPLPTIKPDPTSVWKVYLNRDAQISFKYPPQLALKELKNSANLYTLTLTDEASASGVPIMKILSAKNTTTLDLLGNGEIDSKIKTTESDVDVSGISGKKTLSVLLDNPASSLIYTLIQQDTNAHNFIWYNPTNSDLYTQILASVRFVSPGITPDWQSYSNTFGSYSLRFPPSWTMNTSDNKASSSAQTVSIRKNPSEAQFQNFVIQTTIADAKTKVELTATEIVSSIQNLAGWRETPTLDFRTIGGAQSEILSGEKDGSWYVYAVMWFRNTLVEISWRDALLRQEQDTFNDILGSMKFR